MFVPARSLLRRVVTFALFLAFAASGAARVAWASSCPEPIVTGLTPAQVAASGGEHLTIHGDNFVSGGAAKVQIGLASPTIVSMSEQQIVVVAPPQGDDDAPAVSVWRNLRPHSNVVQVLGYLAPSIDPAAAAGSFRGGGAVITVHGANFTCAAPEAYLYSSGSGATWPARVLANDDTTIVVATGDCDDGDPTAELHVTFTHLHQQNIVHRDLAARNVLLSGPHAPTLSSSSGPACGGAVITLTGSGFSAGGSPPRVTFCGDDGCADGIVKSWNDTQVVVATPNVSPDGPARLVRKARIWIQAAASANRSYTFDPTPVLHAVRATSLPAVGGATLTIVGDNFGAGATVQIGGAAAPTTVLSTSMLTCVSPPLPGGTADLVVAQSGLVSPPVTLPVLAPPTISNVTPTEAAGEGGTLLTIVGTNFGPAGDFANASVQVKQAGKPATNCGPVRWMAPEVLAVSVPAGIAGPADLRVTINGVTVTRPNALTILAPVALTAPVLTNLTPTAATRAGGGLLTITGNNFTAGAGPTQVRYGTSLVSPLSLTNTSIILTQPAIAEGVATTPVEVLRGGTKGSNPLYEDTGNATMNVLSGTASLPYSGGAVLTMSGNNFGSDVRVRLTSTSGESHELAPLSVSPTQITFVAPEFAPGGSVTVSAVHGAQVSNVLTVPYNGPAITSATPASISPAGGTLLTITGTQFGLTPGVVTVGELPLEVQGWSDTQVRLKTTTKTQGDFNLSTGRVTAAGGKGSNGIPIKWSAPEVLRLSEPAAPAAGGYPITIQGSDFSPSATVEFADGLAGPPITIVDRSATNFAILLGGGSAGSRTLRLGSEWDPAGTALPLELLAPPLVGGVTPSSAPLQGGAQITITGSNFGPTGTSRAVHFAGVDDCPMPIIAESPTKLTCLLPPGTSTGARDLIVEIAGVADTIPNAFTYGAAGVAPGAEGARFAFAPLRSPFASELTLRLSLPSAGAWQVRVYDARGAIVRRLGGEHAAGSFEVRWNGRGEDGRNAPPGVYFARLVAAGRTLDARVVKLQ